jgi:hypothetical protein
MGANARAMDIGRSISGVTRLVRFMLMIAVRLLPCALLRWSNTATSS